MFGGDEEDWADSFCLVSHYYPEWDLNDIDELQLEILISRINMLERIKSDSIAASLAKILAKAFGGK